MKTNCSIDFGEKGILIENLVHVFVNVDITFIGCFIREIDLSTLSLMIGLYDCKPLIWAQKSKHQIFDIEQP